MANPLSPLGGAPAGWFGKLPSLGDFASRRLPPAFLEPWDHWLSQAMQGSRQWLGEQWLDCYLECPVWRFVWVPQEYPAAQAWAGVLMASVDRVGRHFPLTVAAPVAGAPPDGAGLSALWQWLDGIERVALDALEQEYAAERLDGALAHHPLPGGPHAGGAPAMDGWLSLARGLSLWLTPPAAGRPLGMHLQQGLPAPRTFASMLAGVAL